MEQLYIKSFSVRKYIIKTMILYDDYEVCWENICTFFPVNFQASSIFKGIYLFYI